MRELLENALYAPTAGRYKVYIIDEVHMLSRNAFNAMLKTLEEPPEHVKFILATTDPQKVPVTVLSRCLQFNLKQIPPQQIRERLCSTCSTPRASRYEAAALAAARARGAGQPARRALSLLDQAIAHGGGQRRGGIGARDAGRGRAGLPARDPARACRAATARRSSPRRTGWPSRSLSFETALQELATLLHRLALLQTVPQALADDDPDRAALARARRALRAGGPAALLPDRACRAGAISARAGRVRRVSP